MDIIKQALNLKPGEDIIVTVDRDTCKAWLLAVETEKNLRLIQRTALENDDFTWEDYGKAMFDADRQVVKRDRILFKACADILGDESAVEMLRENGVFMQLDAKNNAMRIFRG